MSDAKFSTAITDWMRANMFKRSKPLFMILPIVVCAIVVVVVVLIISRIGVYTIDEPVYRFENGVKHEYTGKTEIKRDDKDVVTLTNNGRSEALESVPLYFDPNPADPDAADQADQSQAGQSAAKKNPTKVLIPTRMIYVDPWTMRMGRTGYNTLLTMEGSSRTAHTDSRDISLGAGFIYDGRNTYIFLDPMTLEYGGKTIDLPPLSYAMVYYDLRIEIYTPNGETAIVEQTGPVKVNADSKDTTDGGYHIDLSMDILRSKNGETLLITQPSLLDELRNEPNDDSAANQADDPAADQADDQATEPATGQKK
jgi:hypothetical protein